MTETPAHLTRLRIEHVRVSASLASLEIDRTSNGRRSTVLRKILAALESAIWFEEARAAEER